MNLRSLFMLTLIALGAWWWLRTREQKELAIQATARRCEELSLKLLDQTVALKRTRLMRDPKGRVRLLRLYAFDFTSTGEDRYQGEIELMGWQVLAIRFPPHRVNDTQH